MKKFISAIVLSVLLYFLFRFYVLYALILWGVIEILIYGIYKKKFFIFTLDFFGNIIYGLLYLFDVVCNILFQIPLNRIMLKEDKSDLFGSYKDSISRVLGKNKQKDNLSKTGQFLCRMLNVIDKDHCIKSI